MNTKIFAIGHTLETGALPEKSANTLAQQAIELCLNKANKKVEDVNLLIHLADPPDHVLGDVNRLQNKIQAYNAATYQVKQSSGAILAAFLQASAFIEAGIHRNVLLSVVQNQCSATAVLFTQAQEPSGLVFHRTTGLTNGNSQLAAEKNIEKIVEKLFAQPLHVDWLVSDSCNEPYPITESSKVLASQTKSEQQNVLLSLAQAMEQNKFASGERVLLVSSDEKQLTSLIWQW